MDLSYAVVQAVVNWLLDRFAGISHRTSRIDIPLRKHGLLRVCSCEFRWIFVDTIPAPFQALYGFPFRRKQRRGSSTVGSDSYVPLFCFVFFSSSMRKREAFVPVVRPCNPASMRAHRTESTRAEMPSITREFGTRRILTFGWLFPWFK